MVLWIIRWYIILLDVDIIYFVVACIVHFGYSCKSVRWWCQMAWRCCYVTILVTTSRLRLRLRVRWTRIHTVRAMGDSLRAISWKMMSRNCRSHNLRISYFRARKWPLRTTVLTQYSWNAFQENSKNCWSLLRVTTSCHTRCRMSCTHSMRDIISIVQRSRAGLAEGSSSHHTSGLIPP